MNKLFSFIVSIILITTPTGVHSSYETISDNNKEEIINRVSQYSNSQLLKKQFSWQCLMRGTPLDQQPNSTSGNDVEEDDDDELIYFELNAINIAIAIGGAALLSSIFGSDSDSDDGDSTFPVITRWR